MKTREFYNSAHASSYLSNSIIRVADEPVVVVDAVGTRGKYNIIYHRLVDLGSGEGAKSIAYNDPDVDMSPVPLGFSWTDNPVISGYNMNYTVHIHRNPVRAWKVGLYNRNAEVVKVLGQGSERLKSYWIPSKMLRDTIVGIYPTIDEALSLVEMKQGVVPFSRRFAVYGNSLIYKTFMEPVGYVNERNSEPQLGERYQFLKEVLEEDLR